MTSSRVCRPVIEPRVVLVASLGSRILRAHFSAFTFFALTEYMADLPEERVPRRGSARSQHVRKRAFSRLEHDSIFTVTDVYRHVLFLPDKRMTRRKITWIEIAEAYRSISAAISGTVWRNSSRACSVQNRSMCTTASSASASSVFIPVNRDESNLSRRARKEREKFAH